MFLVYLDVEEYIESDKERKILFLRTIKEAKCVPLAKVHAMYDKLFGTTQASAIDGSSSGYDALEEALAPRPGLLRIATMDECPFGLRTPFFNMLPTEIDDKYIELARSQTPLDGDWLKAFRKEISRWDNEWKPPIRETAFHGWIAKEQHHCINASMHAMDLRKQPNRTG